MGYHVPTAAEMNEALREQLAEEAEMDRERDAEYDDGSIKYLPGYAALAATRDAAADQLGWQLGIDMVNFSVHAFRLGGTDAAGGVISGHVVGNSHGWQWRTLDARGLPIACGTAQDCEDAMRAALPFNHTALNP